MNKIHFTLACSKESAQLLAALGKKMQAQRDRSRLISLDEYLASADLTSRFDSPEVVAIKRLLQRDLPLWCRSKIVGELFREFVTCDEAGFAEELYLSCDHVGEMARHGMRLGHHGYDHRWLTHLTPGERTKELQLGLEFLARWGEGGERWIMCYPYGAFNPEIVEEVEEAGCAMAFTTVPGLAGAEPERRLTLPRLDTNDLPRDAGAPANDWTLRAFVGKTEGLPGGSQPDDEPTMSSKRCRGGPDC